MLEVKVRSMSFTSMQRLMEADGMEVNRAARNVHFNPSSSCHIFSRLPLIFHCPYNFPYPHSLYNPTNATQFSSVSMFWFRTWECLQLPFLAMARVDPKIMQLTMQSVEFTFVPLPCRGSRESIQTLRRPRVDPKR